MFGVGNVWVVFLFIFYVVLFNGDLGCCVLELIRYCKVRNFGRLIIIVDGRYVVLIVVFDGEGE